MQGKGEGEGRRRAGSAQGGPREARAARATTYVAPLPGSAPIPGSEAGLGLVPRAAPFPRRPKSVAAEGLFGGPYEDEVRGPPRAGRRAGTPLDGDPRFAAAQRRGVLDRLLVASEAQVAREDAAAARSALVREGNVEARGAEEARPEEMPLRKALAARAALGGLTAEGDVRKSAFRLDVDKEIDDVFAARFPRPDTLVVGRGADGAPLTLKGALPVPGAAVDGVPVEELVPHRVRSDVHPALGDEMLGTSGRGAGSADRMAAKPQPTTPQGGEALRRSAYRVPHRTNVLTGPRLKDRDCVADVHQWPETRRAVPTAEKEDRGVPDYVVTGEEAATYMIELSAGGRIDFVPDAHGTRHVFLDFADPAPRGESAGHARGAGEGGGRAVQPVSLHLYKDPYFLKVVPAGRAGPEHFVMTAYTVTHIRGDLPGESETLTLKEWIRHAAVYRALRAKRFFRQFLITIHYETWKKEVSVRRFKRRLVELEGKVIKAHPKLFPILADVAKCLRRIPLTVDVLAHFEQYRSPIADHAEFLASRLVDLEVAKAKVDNVLQDAVSIVVDAVSELALDALREAPLLVPTEDRATLSMRALENALDLAQKRSWRDKSTSAAAERGRIAAAKLERDTFLLQSLPVVVRIADLMASQAVGRLANFMFEEMLERVTTQRITFMEDFGRIDDAEARSANQYGLNEYGRLSLFTASLISQRVGDTYEFSFAPTQQDISNIWETLTKAMSDLVHEAQRIEHHHRIEPILDRSEWHLDRKNEAPGRYEKMCGAKRVYQQVKEETAKDFASMRLFLAPYTECLHLIAAADDLGPDTYRLTGDAGKLALWNTEDLVRDLKLFKRLDTLLSHTEIKFRTFGCVHLGYSTLHVDLLPRVEKALVFMASMLGEQEVAHLGKTTAVLFLLSKLLQARPDNIEDFSKLLVLQRECDVDPNGSVTVSRAMKVGNEMRQLMLALNLNADDRYVECWEKLKKELDGYTFSRGMALQFIRRNEKDMRERGLQEMESIVERVTQAMQALWTGQIVWYPPKGMEPDDPDFIPRIHPRDVLSDIIAPLREELERIERRVAIVETAIVGHTFRDQQNSGDPSLGIGKIDFKVLYRVLRLREAFWQARLRWVEFCEGDARRVGVSKLRPRLYDVDVRGDVTVDAPWQRRVGLPDDPISEERLGSGPGGIDALKGAEVVALEIGIYSAHVEGMRNLPVISDANHFRELRGLEVGVLHPDEHASVRGLLKEIRKWNLALPLVRKMEEFALSERHFEEFFSKAGFEEPWRSSSRKENPYSQLSRTSSLKEESQLIQNWIGHELREGDEPPVSKLLDAGIHRHDELVDFLCRKAAGERDLRRRLYLIPHIWDGALFRVDMMKVIQDIGAGSTVQKLVEQTIDAVQCVREEEFADGIAFELGHFRKLGAFLDLFFQELNSCQVTMLRARRLFILEDVRQKSKEETENFDLLWDSWQKDVILSVIKTPEIFPFVFEDKYPVPLLRDLRQRCDSLLRNGHNELLSSKRQAFPRLYLASDYDLLSMLCLTEISVPARGYPLNEGTELLRDIETSFLLHCFQRNGIRSLILEGAEGEVRGNTTVPSLYNVAVRGVIGEDGEELLFVGGGVKGFLSRNLCEWGPEIVAAIRRAVRLGVYNCVEDALRAAVPEERGDKNKDGTFFHVRGDSWLMRYSLQAVRLADEIMWTRACDKALKG